MPANRVVAIAASIVALALAVLPVVADMDWESTAGVIAGIIAVLGIVQRWLDGWQKHEDRQALGAVVDDEREFLAPPPGQPIQVTDDTPDADDPGDREGPPVQPSQAGLT